VFAGEEGVGHDAQRLGVEIGREPTMPMPIGPLPAAPSLIPIAALRSAGRSCEIAEGLKQYHSCIF
jgi:hypothetical protein